MVLRCYIPLPLPSNDGRSDVVVCPCLLVLARTVVFGSMHPVSMLRGEDVHEVDESQRL
jgi:hypothetical protein